MATLAQIKVRLDGAGVTGGGVSTFYCDVAEVSAAPDALESFYSVVAASSPDDVTFTIPADGFTIDDTSGEIDGTWSVAAAGSTFPGAANTGFQMGVGTRVRWLTSGVRNGRHVVGTTFIVPLASSAFTTAGLLASANQAALQAAGNALIASLPIRIVSRPLGPLPDGISSLVDSASVPLQVSWLRSRRT